MKVAILSDLHANKYAVDAVFSDLDRELVDKILIAGDLVGYYYWPEDVVNRCMEDTRITCIQGNHEVNLMRARADEQTRKQLREKYGSGYEVCLANLKSHQLSWLENLKRSVVLELEGTSFFMGHGTLESYDQYLYPTATRDCLKSNYSSCDFTIFGHTHYPFIHHYEGKTLLNPGSVGQPRDIGNLASYAIVDTINRAVIFKRRMFDTCRLVSLASSIDPDNQYLSKILSRGVF